MAENKDQEKQEFTEDINAEEQNTELEENENTATEEAVEGQEEDLTAKMAELQDKYLRLAAEFDNYRKRTLKEKSDLIRTAGKDVIKELLPVMDDFDRAKEAMEGSSDIVAIKEGVELILSKLKSTLTQKGVKEMEVVGVEFDSEIHEAIAKVPAPDKKMKGKIIDQVQKGYILNDEVIRFPKVVVGE